MKAVFFDNALAVGTFSGAGGAEENDVEHELLGNYFVNVS
jgi:hypothetical protein